MSVVMVNDWMPELRTIAGTPSRRRAAVSAYRLRTRDEPVSNDPRAPRGLQGEQSGIGELVFAG